MSINWYKFINYIKTPFSIVYTSIIAIYGYNFWKAFYDKSYLFTWFLTVAIAIFYTILLHKMYYNEKDTYFYFIVSLVLDVIFLIPLLLWKIPYQVSLIVSLIVWFTPNYIYIRKRK